MSLRLPDNLPAIDLLRGENIIVGGDSADAHCVGRPLRIAVLNLMPMKIATETDLVRLLSNSPLHLELHLMKLGGHVSRHTPMEHMQAFYRDFERMRPERFDGMIMTGAPVEHLDYGDVSYWEELKEIMDWCRSNVTSTMFICWAAQAALCHYYGVPKYPLAQKMFGIFEQRPLNPLLPIFRGFDDTFCMPHSRHTEVRREDIERVPELDIVAEGPVSGVSMVMGRGGRELFITGHSEYSPYTLDAEYRRDLSRGLPIQMPCNYYAGDDMEKGVRVTWRGHGNLLFANWLNYYVYRETPHDTDAIG